MIRIKNLRDEQNISLRDLAKNLEISFSSLNKYERGEQEPNIQTIIKIADYFNVSTDYLIGKSNFRTTEDEYKFKSSFSSMENDVAIDLYNAFIDTLNLLSMFHEKNNINNNVSSIFIDHIARIISGYNSIATALINDASYDTLISIIVDNELSYSPSKKLVEELSTLLIKKT